MSESAYPGPTTYPGRGSSLSASGRDATPLQVSPSAIVGMTAPPVTIGSLPITMPLFQHGVYPASTLYPGLSSFPGRAGDLSAQFLSPQTLVVTPV